MKFECTSNFSPLASCSSTCASNRFSSCILVVPLPSPPTNSSYSFLHNSFVQLWIPRILRGIFSSHLYKFAFPFSFFHTSYILLALYFSFSTLGCVYSMWFILSSYNPDGFPIKVNNFTRDLQKIYTIPVRLNQDVINESKNFICVNTQVFIEHPTYCQKYYGYNSRTNENTSHLFIRNAFS